MKWSLALIPLWDMMNHDNHVVRQAETCLLAGSRTRPLDWPCLSAVILTARLQMSTNYDTENEVLEFYAPADLAPGQQLTMFYGDRPNAEFLVHQGFFFDDHRSDFLSLAFGGWAGWLGYCFGCGRLSCEVGLMVGMRSQSFACLSACMPGI